MAWERFWNGGFLLGMRFIACMVLLSGRASFVLGEEGVRGVKAENWVQWRGPTADGIASPTANPPLQWDSKTNIAWVADLPGQGTSTPIIWDDQVFVLSAEKTSRKSLTPVENDERAKTVPDEFFHRFLVTSIDRVTGKMRWQKLATEQVPHEGRHMTNTYAAGSPTTDGERLYVSFGSRGIFCYTLTGDLVWQVDLGDMRTRFGWGEAVTPVLAGDLLIVNWDQEEGSFIIALDKRTGKSVWKVDRPEEVTSWNTPLVTTHDGKQMVIVNGTGSAKAYDAQTGEQIWACGGQTINAIPSPIRFEDTAICMAIELPALLRSRLARTAILPARGWCVGRWLKGRRMSPRQSLAATDCFLRRAIPMSLVASTLARERRYSSERESQAWAPCTPRR